MSLPPAHVLPWALACVFSQGAEWAGSLGPLAHPATGHRRQGASGRCTRLPRVQAPWGSPSLPLTDKTSRKTAFSMWHLRGVGCQGARKCPSNWVPRPASWGSPCV